MTTIDYFAFEAGDVDTAYRVFIDFGGYDRDSRPEIGTVFRVGKDWQYRMRGNAQACNESFFTRKEAVRGLLEELVAVADAPIRDTP